MTDPTSKPEHEQEDLQDEMKALYDELSVVARRLEGLRGRLGQTLRRKGVDVPEEGEPRPGAGGLEDLVSQVSNMFGGDLSSVLAGFGLGAATQAQADEDEDEYEDDECSCDECDDCDCDDESSDDCDCSCGGKDSR